MFNHRLRELMEYQILMIIILLEAKPYWKFRPAG